MIPGRLARVGNQSSDPAAIRCLIVKQGWGADNPAFRQIFYKLHRLSGSPECRRQRSSCMFATTPEFRANWAANWRREYRVPGSQLGMQRGVN